MFLRFKYFAVAAGLVVIGFNGLLSFCAEEPVPIIPSTAPAHVWRSLPNKAFGTSEDLRFVIRWGVITAGNSSLTVDGVQVLADRQVYHLVSEAHSTGVVDTFYRVTDRNEAWLDTASLTSLGYSKHLHEGSFQENSDVTFDQAARHWVRVTHRVDKNSIENKEGELPPDCLDIQSSLYLTRTMSLEVGKTFSIDVQSSDKIYPVVVNVLRRQTIKVPAGTFDCFLVEPQLRTPGMFIAKGKKLQVWLTADARHMPVRMRTEVFFGHVVADLLTYHVTAPDPS